MPRLAAAQGVVELSDTFASGFDFALKTQAQRFSRQ
jgi:hypothetical protein